MKTINHHRRGFLGCTFKAEKQNVKVKEVYLNASFFKQEDIIYSIQNEPIESMYQLEAIIKKYHAGDSLDITVVRNEKYISHNCILYEYPRESSSLFDIEYDSFIYKNLFIELLITKPNDNDFVLFLLQGIDCSTIDTPLLCKNTYRDLMYSLSNFGIPTVRVELFGNGDSDGYKCGKYGFNDIIDLYDAAMHHVVASGKKLILFGYSIGALMVPSLVNRNRESVLAAIIFDTMIFGPKDYFVKNKIRQDILRGIPKDKIMYNARTFDSFIEIVLDGKHSINDIVKQNPQYSTYVEHGLFAGHDTNYYHELSKIDFLSGCKSISLPLLLLIGSRDCAIDFKQHLFFFNSISSTGSDIIHKEVFSIDHSFRNETGSIDSECIKCICDFIFEIVMKHIPFDGGRA